MAATTVTTTNFTTEATPATIAKGGAIGIGLALIANVAIYLVGNSGAPLQVVMSGDTAASDLLIGFVVGASLLPLVIAAAGLWVFERFLPNGFRLWAGTVAVLAVATIAAPVSLDVDTGSKVALALMHIAVGAAAIAGQALARRAPDSSRPGTERVAP